MKIPYRAGAVEARRRDLVRTWTRRSHSTPSSLVGSTFGGACVRSLRQVPNAEVVWLSA